MPVNALEKLFEHNNWANQQIIQACLALTDEELDAEPQSATKGTIRRTLIHLVSSQLSYLRTLTLTRSERMQPTRVEYADLLESAGESGEALLALARSPERLPEGQIETRDGSLAQPWVLMVQIINHATEHREQIKSMLTALGKTPPEIDGWDFGGVSQAFFPATA
jgi:uncharacterized damage-inducible protein DinB